MAPTTDPVAAKLLDELIIQFGIHRQYNCYIAYNEAIEYIKRAAREHPDQPVTLSLARHFDASDPGWRDPAPVSPPAAGPGTSPPATPRP